MNLLMRECLFYLGTVKEQKKIYVLLGPLIKRSGKVVHIRSLVQPYKEVLRFGYGQHNRWKRTYEEFVIRQTNKNGELSLN